VEVAGAGYTEITPWAVSAAAAAVPAGFFRANLLVVMGAATFAALALAGDGWLWTLPAAAAPRP
jgi:hypothetical protein